MSVDIYAFMVYHNILLPFQGDVYINSTNPSLDLSQGIISKMLLKACGPQLQEECKEYAPLAPGAVAVTSAANLKCKYIFHVSLPGYSSSGSENVSNTHSAHLICG